MGGCASKPKNVMDGDAAHNAPIELSTSSKVPVDIVDATTIAQATTESDENVEMNSKEDPSVDLAKLNPSEVAVEAVNDANEPKTAATETMNEPKAKATEVREVITDAAVVNEIKTDTIEVSESTTDAIEVSELKTNTVEIEDTSAKEKVAEGKGTENKQSTS